MTSSWLLFAGTANPSLAARVADELGRPLGACTVQRFPDGEVSVQLEESVRGCDVFVLQPTSPPVNDHLIELLVFADACRRADAKRITAIVPYFGYARSDKRQGRRTPVTARAVADLMQSVGIGRIVTIDAHTPQLEGFFRIPSDDLSAVPLLCEPFRARIARDAVIVSPDLGGVRRATEYAARLGRPTAVCVKRRTSGTTVVETQVIGDVRGRTCVIVDDMITTGETIAESAKLLMANGAREGFIAAATHGVLVSDARERMRAAGITELSVSDTIMLEDGGEPPLTRVTVAPLLSGAVRRLAAGKSLRALADPSAR